MQTCASENICISTGYFCREDKCVKICLLEKNSGFDCLPNITQVISDVVKCSAALLRLGFFFDHSVKPQFFDQGLNPGLCSESPES